MRDIKQVRDRLGLSTAQLAQLVGVKYRTAHRWMMGEAVPEPVWRLLETIMDHPEIRATLAFCDAWKAIDREIINGTVNTP